MATFVDLEEIDQGVLNISHSSFEDRGKHFEMEGTYDRSGKRPIQPPSPLTNQFSSLFRDIRLCFTRLHIAQCPLITSFGD